MASVRDLLEEAAGRFDATLPVTLYAAVSVSPEAVRRMLRLAGRPFDDPEAPVRPPAAQIEQTAAWVLGQSRFRMGLVGAAAGMGGAASVAPEALAVTISALRLAQRLAVVYGFDPSSERGTLAVWRALAAGFEVELPGDGPVGLRASEIPAALLPGVKRRTAGGELARSILVESAIGIAGRVTRILPLPFLSPGLSAAAAARRTEAIGDRMRATLRGLAEAPPADPSLVVDAIEVG